MALYSYVNASGKTVTIDGKNINFYNSWSNSAHYQPKDSVVYNSRRFIAVVSNTGITPPTTLSSDVPTTWSSLVLVHDSPVADAEGDAQAAYSLANFALSVASAGTNAATQALAVANEALGIAQSGTDAAHAALNHFSVAANGTTAVWVTTTQNGAITDTRLTFIDGILARKTVDNSLPTSTSEIFSFVNFLNFVAPAGQSHNCFGTFVVGLHSVDFSWTNGNTYLYNRVGSQDVGGIASVQIVNGPFESADVVMNFPHAGTGASQFGALSAPDQVTKLFQQGTYYMWNRDGAPPSDVIFSMRLDGLAFNGG